MEVNSTPNTRPILFIIIGLAALLLFGLAVLLILLLLPKSPSAPAPAVAAATVQATKVSIATTAPVSFATATATRVAAASPSATNAIPTVTPAPTKALAATSAGAGSSASNPPAQPAARSGVGVYVTGIYMDPPAPRGETKPTFVVSFENTTGSAKEFRWFIQIYDGRNQKRFGETKMHVQAVPAGSSRLTSIPGWGVSGGGGCIPFFAKVEYIDEATGSRIVFTRPDGGAAQLNFTFCTEK